VGIAKRLNPNPIASAARKKAATYRGGFLVAVEA
jgi:hypothetical protein